MDFSYQEVRDYLEWVTTADRDGMPVPRIEPERARISRMRAEDRAEAAERSRRPSCRSSSSSRTRPDARAPTAP